MYIYTVENKKLTQKYGKPEEKDKDSAFSNVEVKDETKTKESK